MFRANETDFNDPLQITVHYHNSGYVDPNKQQRTFWWTNHLLESTPSSKLPAPHTLLYNDDFDWYDSSRWVLDLSYETVLGESIQLEPLDLSLKTIPEFGLPQTHASELLKLLLSSDNLKISKELEIVPFYPGEKSERGYQVSQRSQVEQYNNRTSWSASTSTYAANSSLMHVPHRYPDSHPKNIFTEDVGNKKSSGGAKNSGKKYRTLRLPPPPPEPRPLQSNSRMRSNPKGIVEYVKYLERYGELYNNPLSQQETPLKTTPSQHEQTTSYETSKPSTGRGFVSSNQAQENFIDPAVIRRPPVKRNQTEYSSGFRSPSIVPLRASEATVAPGTHNGYSTQPSTGAVTLPLYYTSACLQSSSSHRIAPQSKEQAITPAVASLSSPSLSPSATPSSAPIASRQYSRSNLSWHPYSQRVSVRTPSRRTYSVSKPSPSSVPSGSATTARFLSVSRSTQPKHHNLSANKRDDAESGSTFTSDDLERANSPLHERWLKQNFERMIEDPDAYRGSQMIPGSSRHKNSEKCSVGTQTATACGLSTSCCINQEQMP